MLEVHGTAERAVEELLEHRRPKQTKDEREEIEEVTDGRDLLEHHEHYVRALFSPSALAGDSDLGLLFGLACSGEDEDQQVVEQT